VYTKGLIAYPARQPGTLLTVREIHNPTIKPKLHKTFSSYKKSQSTSLNHFYEKLLLLKNLMNTKTAKEIAQHRHEFMEQYLREFYQEWEAKK